MAAAAGNWADLPQELLDEIAKRLTFFADLIRLRAVCVSWLSALPNTPKLFPPRFPLLMIPSDSTGETTYEFFSIAENKSYFLDFPLEMSKKKFLARSSHGCLVINDESSLGLFNPFTRVYIRLPSVYKYCLGHEDFRFKLEFSASPCSDFLAVLFFAPLLLLICRCGDKSWTAIEDAGFTEDVMFHKQQIITLTNHGEVVIREVVCGNGNSSIKIHIKQILQQPPHLASSRLEFLCSFLDEYDDDLLVLFQYDFTSCEVYKLHWNKNATRDINAEWSEMKSLANRMYFQGISPPSCFLARDFPGCRGNCLYFRPSPYFASPTEDSKAQGFPMFDLADKRVKPWPAYPQGVFEKECIWITPTLV